MHLQRKLIKRLKNAAIIQIRYYDKKHMLKNYRAENKILLNSKNIISNQTVRRDGTGLEFSVPSRSRNKINFEIPVP